LNELTPIAGAGEKNDSMISGNRLQMKTFVEKQNIVNGKIAYVA
jgi:hypothetical protein